MKNAIMVLALVGVLASPRPAAAITGNQFLDMCKNNEVACFAYLNGWLDAFVVTTMYMKGDENYEKRKHNPKMRICIPSEVTVDQKKRVLLKYLRNHPATLHLNTTLLTHKAMREAFPCR